MHNILRNKYFDIVSQGDENISSGLECCSGLLRLITLCKNSHISGLAVVTEKIF